MNKIKYLFCLVAFLFVSVIAWAQPKNPVHWTFEANYLGNDEYNLIFSAKIDEGWNTYSPFTGEDGPVPTSINYDSEEDFELIGKIEEFTAKPENRKEGVDPLFDNAIVIKYKNDLTLVQKIKSTNPDLVISGYIESMACDAESCLPPRAEDFEISLKGDMAIVDNDLPKANIDNSINEEIARPLIKESLAKLSAENSCSPAEETKSDSNIMIFVFGFLGGLVALLTPCVFPMIPLTVSYFTKRSKTRAEGLRNASIYSFSIIAIYVALGLLVTMAFGADALNQLSTHWLPNTIFFLLFVVFAFSFFGFYDISLPSSWTNKTDAAADKGGVLGIFFMAFTLALVSFSCTGPIIGTLLVQASQGGWVGPLFGMTGFAVALALPFGLFSLFPTMLNALPRSGGWMNTVKVLLGFIELALAFKFLSKADLTEHWGLLKYETFLAISVVCTLGIGIYLFGFIKFPHDSHKWGKSSAGGYVMGIAAFAFAAYLASGFTVNKETNTYNTPALLSGIVPPACYSYYHPCDCPAGIGSCYKDYYQGLAYAKKVNKPILLDFTGHACENCRKMEDQVWVNPEVNKLINENYVLVSLYVDDRKPLDEIKMTKDGRKLRTVGNIWAEFEMENFNQQSQPLYILLSPNEEVLHAPIGATLGANGVERYLQFLKCGLQ